ncbi:hypothetical protein GOC57_28805 [Sinorhizobium meliloti]|nr:hypothetical protein [Sinorhizobium meliloti]MDW9496337.1 hypothetical protein [Sinorhizobium meliloti]MDW9564817.1 hypothetical protein [Sinorhizobium meliloti]MDW9652278.1 hypothetical protein [Sinorhizobium meliloti]MDW9862651.1 hypothetical protein [Sinorhizobium meliloti]
MPLGISVLPRMATPQDDHPLLITLPISDPEISRTIGVVRRRGGTLSPAAETFLKMLMDVWGSN